MTTAVLGALVGAVICVAVSPYLARLSVTVPDADHPRWWAGAPADGRRVVTAAVTAAVLGALGGYAAGWSALLPAFVALALACTPLIVIDLEVHRLPNRIVYPMAIVGAVLLALAAAVDDDWHRLLRSAEGAAAVYAVLFMLVLASPRSFGLGDVRIGGVLGGYLGWFGWVYVYYGIFAGFLLGALVAIVLLVTRRASMKTAIPFGPTLILGPLIVLAFDLVPSAF